MVCVQAAGCSPIYNAFIAGTEQVERIEKPDTFAHGIVNTLPLSGNQVLRILKRNNGLCISVTDEEIIHAQAVLARTGLFVQPESAASLAAVKILKEEKNFRGGEKVLCVLTGSGLKYTAAFEHHELNYHLCKLDEMDNFLGSQQ